MRHADVTDEYLLSGVKRTSGAQYSESADALYQSDYPTLISPKRLRNSNFVIETGAGRGQPRPTFMWFPISTAPFDRDLELGIVDSSGVRAISFPCRRIVGGWIKAETKDACCRVSDALARLVYRRERGPLAFQTPDGAL